MTHLKITKTVIFFSLLAATSAQARVHLNITPTVIGDFSSYTLSAPSYASSYSATTSPKFAPGGGVLIEWLWGRKVIFETGGLYVPRTYQVNASIGGTTATRTETVPMVEVPAFFQIWISSKFYLGLGGYYDFGLGKVSQTTSSGTNQVAFSDADIYDQDYGATVGFGFGIKRLMLGIRGNYGVKNASILTDFTQHYWDAMFLLGFRLGAYANK